jgi:hypothetical protein
MNALEGGRDHLCHVLSLLRLPAMLPSSHRSGRLPLPDPAEINWNTLFGYDIRSYSISQKISLIYSLVLYLGFTFRSFLTVLFTSEDEQLSKHVNRFYNCRKDGRVIKEFGPMDLWNIWAEYSDTLKAHLYNEIVWPAAFVLGREEMYRAVRDTELKFDPKDLTVDLVNSKFDAQVFRSAYEERLPFVYRFLIHLMETPNEHRGRRIKQGAKPLNDDSSQQGVGNPEDSDSGDSDDDKPTANANTGSPSHKGLVPTYTLPPKRYLVSATFAMKPDLTEQICRLRPLLYRRCSMPAIVAPTSFNQLLEWHYPSKAQVHVSYDLLAPWG